MVAKLTNKEKLLIERLSESLGVVSVSTLGDSIDTVAISPSEVVKGIICSIRKKLGKGAIITHRKSGYSLARNKLCPTCTQPLSNIIGTPTNV